MHNAGFTNSINITRKHDTRLHYGILKYETRLICQIYISCTFWSQRSAPPTLKPVRPRLTCLSPLPDHPVQFLEP